MAETSITLPSGTVLTFPEGTPKEKILAKAREINAQEKRLSPEQLGALARKSPSIGQELGHDAGVLWTGLVKGLANIPGQLGDIQQNAAGPQPLPDGSVAPAPGNTPGQNFLGFVPPQLPTSTDVQNAIKPYVPGWTDPTTLAGKVVQKGVEAAAPAIVGGAVAGAAGEAGVLPRVGGAVRGAVNAPGVLAGAGGAAGEAVQEKLPETPLKQPLVMAAAMMTPVFMSLARAGYAAFAPQRAEKVVQDVLRRNNVTPQELQDADNLVQEAVAAGTPITWGQAINHTTNGRVTQFLEWEKVAEQSTGGAPRMNEFYTRFNQQFPAQARRAFEGAGQASTGDTLLNRPEAVPGRLQRAANAAVRTAKNVVGRKARGAIGGGDAINLPDAPVAGAVEQLQALADAPGSASVASKYRGLIRDLRQLPATEGAPTTYTTNVGRLSQVVNRWRDAVTPRHGMQMQTAADAAAQRELARTVTPILDSLEYQMRMHSPSYAQGMDIFQRGRETVVAPLKRTPLGPIAKRQDPATGLPATPESAVFGPNATPENIRSSVMRLEREDPSVAQRWITLNLQHELDDAISGQAEGLNPGGTKSWWTALSGTPKLANIEAWIGALPNGAQRLAGFRAFTAIVDAHARRIMTGEGGGLFGETTRQMARPQHGASPLSLVTSPMYRARVWLDDYRRGVNTRDLANIVTDPAYGQRMAALARAPAERRNDLVQALIMDWVAHHSPDYNTMEPQP